MESPPITAFGSQESGFQFYKESSTMTRVDKDTEEFTASSIMDIHSILTSMNYTGIEISKLKCQDSLNGSVLVMVSGYAKSTNFSGRRTFTQVFFRAPQEQGQSYFVLNDIFEFTEEMQVNQQPPLEAPVPEIPDMELVMKYTVHVM